MNFFFEKFCLIFLDQYLGTNNRQDQQDHNLKETSEWGPHQMR